MGHGFGQLAKIRGLVYYKLSPFEQKAFAGFFTKGFPNLVRRIREQIFVVVPPFIGAYIIYDQAEKEHKRQMRKNPEDYANDV